MDFKIEIFNSTEREVQAILSRLIMLSPTYEGLELVPEMDAEPEITGPEQVVPPVESEQTKPETTGTRRPPPPPPTAETVELDTTGLPWDERIHANGAQKKNKDGSWRRKRNLKDDIYSSVVTELREAYPIVTLGTVPDGGPPAPPTSESETTDPNKVPTNYLEFTRFLRSLGFNDVAAQSAVVQPYGITSVALLSAMAKDEPGIYARLHTALIG